MSRTRHGWAGVGWSAGEAGEKLTAPALDPKSMELLEQRLLPEVEQVEAELRRSASSRTACPWPSL